MLFEETTIGVPDVALPMKAARLIKLRGENLLAVVDSGHQLLILNFDGTVHSRLNLNPDLPVAKFALKIYSRDQWIVVVEEKGVRGIVVNLDDADWRMVLSREDYHVNHCSWAIGFFRREDAVVLIHATEWNRLDMTSLDTRQCLTEREVCSGIADGTETTNYLDFFHSRLHMAPDEKHFVINGWCWSPWDVMYAWNIDQFGDTFEPGGFCLNALDRNGYNWDRPCCFVDNETTAWGYNEREAGNGGVPDDQPTELVFQNIHSAKIVRRMPFEYFELSGEKEAYGRLWFDTHQRLFIASPNLRGEDFKFNHGEKLRETFAVDESGALIKSWPVIAEFVEPTMATMGFIEEGSLRLIHWKSDPVDA